MIYAVMSQKGGVGKTSIALNVAACLANKKKKVLLVDADQQANATYGLGAGKSVKYSLVDVFKGKAKASAAIIPGKVDLLSATGEIAGEKVKYDSFKKALAGLEYDYIIIDCPPGFTETTKAVFLAADRIILPVLMDAFCLYSLKQFKSFYDEAKEINKGLKISGIVRCRYVERQKVTRIVDENLQECSKAFGMKIYKTALRECTAVRECAYMQQDIFTYSPKSKAAEDFAELTKEIMKER